MSKPLDDLGADGFGHLQPGTTAACMNAAVS
jgi:hypothetical protein